jgi:hypothetical protein
MNCPSEGGSWQVNGVVILSSGTPYFVTYNGDLANTGNSFVNVSDIGNAAPAHGTPAQWINPSSFPTPAPYTFGTMGGNSLRSDWNRNIDLSLFRTLAIFERVNLELRAEAFNLADTAVFGVPGNVSCAQLCRCD